MTDADPRQAAPVEHGELVDPSQLPGQERPQQEEAPREVIEEPAKVMRIGSMIKQLLDEVRAAEVDEGGRARLQAIYDRSIEELATALSPDLADELRRIVSPFEGESPTMGEVRVAQAQLVGWLEGLFHGIQATLFAQQAAARQQLEQMRRELGPGGRGPDGDPRPGTYL